MTGELLVRVRRKRVGAQHVAVQLTDAGPHQPSGVRQRRGVALDGLATADSTAGPSPRPLPQPTGSSTTAPSRRTRGGAAVAIVGSPGSVPSGCSSRRVGITPVSGPTQPSSRVSSAFRSVGNSSPSESLGNGPGQQGQPGDATTACRCAVVAARSTVTRCPRQGPVPSTSCRSAGRCRSSRRAASSASAAGGLAVLGGGPPRAASIRSSAQFVHTGQSARLSGPSRTPACGSRTRSIQRSP